VGAAVVVGLAVKLADVRAGQLEGEHCSYFLRALWTDCLRFYGDNDISTKFVPT
jgi:hypothetical protein